jgi:hypothetical protein
VIGALEGMRDNLLEDLYIQLGDEGAEGAEGAGQDDNENGSSHAMQADDENIDVDDEET